MLHDWLRQGVGAAKALRRTECFGQEATPLRVTVGENRVDTREFVVGEGEAFYGPQVFQQLRGTPICPTVGVVVGHR